MKMIVPEAQRGLLYRNGRLEEWLEPGKHVRWAWLDTLRVEWVDLSNPVQAFRPELARVAPGVAWTELTVEPNEIAIVSVDGLPNTGLRPGRYMLWQARSEVEADVYSLESLRPEIPEPVWHLVPSDLVTSVTIAPYERLLVYEDGRLAAQLQEGRALLSRLNRDLNLVRVDVREQERAIVGQEVMTADKVSLRMNVVFKYRTVDAVRSVEQVASLNDALYSEAQMAVRRTVAGLRLDQLLENRREVGGAMTEQVAARAEAWGVDVVAVDVKDVVLPGEMKALMNRVIEAEKQAAAQVILRREETAATRSQANTAKMLEANPVLLRLKEMEALKEIAQSLDQVTLVAGAGDLVDRLITRQVNPKP